MLEWQPAHRKSRRNSKETILGHILDLISVQRVDTRLLKILKMTEISFQCVQLLLNVTLGIPVEHYQLIFSILRE